MVGKVRLYAALFNLDKIFNFQETLQGVLPPPSVTTLKTDVTEMLKKYYTYLPQFNPTSNIDDTSTTPTKKVSFILIPEMCNSLQETTKIGAEDGQIGTISIKTEEKVHTKITNVEAEKIKLFGGDISKSESNLSICDKSIGLKLCSETDVKESVWPDVLRCRYHDV